MESAPHPLWIASEEEISRGEVSDASSLLGAEALRGKELNPHVRTEVRASNLPRAWEWALMVGADELSALLARVNVRVTAMPEGGIFHPGDPVVVIEGRYLDIASYERAIVGLLGQSSGVATVAARTRRLAEGRPVHQFGPSTLHPTIAPMVGRAGFIGGCEGVSESRTADLIGERASGPIPPSLLVSLGDYRRALGVFDEVITADTLRICPVGVLSDELSEALAAAGALGDRLDGVVVNAASCKGEELRSMLASLKWELGLRGYSHVKVILAGPFTESEMPALNRLVDAYDASDALSRSPVIDFSVDIVEVDGVPRSRLGVPSGAKSLWGCAICGHTQVTPRRASAPEHCSATMMDMLPVLVELGVTRPRRSALRIREDVAASLARLPLVVPA